ncbi:unnamed protein product [Colias eurytheme]|nr:unnamed protein product [Colias eurytheme]
MGQRGKASKDIMNLADFRSELADTLCKYSTPIPRGRLRSTSTTAAGPPPKIRKGKPCQVLPPNDVILDGFNNLLKK